MQTILGNDTLIENLKRIASSNRVMNGIILSGQKGTGKKMLASYFATLLHVSPADILYLEHEKENLISVDDIRTGINQTISIRPYESTRKIYIVPNAEKMNVQAQNALLKTLEEPPEYVTIILLSENADTFLETILSRCVVFEVRPLSENLLNTVLLQKGYEPDQIKKVLKVSSGSVGKAVELLESEDFTQIFDAVLNLLSEIPTMDMKGILDFIKSMDKYKIHAMEILEYFRLWFLDVLLLKTKANESLLTFETKIRPLKIQAEKLSFEGVKAILKEIDQAKLRINANVNFEMTEEILLLKIRDLLSERK